MSDPFIGQITMFGGTFAPRSWANCDGQLLPISQNSALFSILGTIYGGDGRTTFALPDLRGRAPMHVGTGAGLTPRTQGQRSGTETNTLSVGQMPSHSHAVRCSTDDGETDEPQDAYHAKAGGGETIYASGNDDLMASDSTANTGGNQSVNNMQPFLVIRFIIALQGVFPSRS